MKSFHKIILFSIIISFFAASCFEEKQNNSHVFSPRVVNLLPEIVPDMNSVKLFDRDTETAFEVQGTESVNVKFHESYTIKRIRIFGNSFKNINIYQIENNDASIVSSLSIEGASLSSSWNSIISETEVTANYLRLEIVSEEGKTSSVPEFEIWGEKVNEVEEGKTSYSLEGIKSADGLKSIIDQKYPHIHTFSASSSDVSISGDDSTAVTSFKIDLSIDPALSKRAYIMYRGYDIFSPVSIKRQVNNLSWAGGFEIDHDQKIEPAWNEYAEEINPDWLFKGENTIEFQTKLVSSPIKDLVLVLETDSGWNFISSCSDNKAYDFDKYTSSSVPIDDGKFEVYFHRLIEPEAIVINLSGSFQAKAKIQYKNDFGWNDVKRDHEIDLSSFKSGWNEITLPAVVSTDEIRLVLSRKGNDPKDAGAELNINEIRVCASPIGQKSRRPEVVVSYPRNGEYSGRTAYVQGFVIPTTLNGTIAKINMEGKYANRTVQDGSFSMALSKDDTRFYVQEDDISWSPIVQSLVNNVAIATKSVDLYNNLVNPENDDKDDGGIDGSIDPNLDDGTEGDDGSFTSKVHPKWSKSINYRDVTINLPAGAVDTETDITIIPLTADQIPELDPGMINVTSPAPGYRFLPHGIKFKKKISISFGYAKELFVPGQKDEDVNMYYYHEKFETWMKLKKAKVDVDNQVVVSESDHFTDIINSTLVVPEHPDAMSFNPNSIKDIKAADPSTGVNLIEPPKATNTGDASIAYPIEIPKGRNGMQPQLAVRYNSSGGNGWMGLGWNISTSSISLNTKYGVPSYSDSNRSDVVDTYIIDGSEMEKMSDGTYKPRIEGEFRKIVRHGTSPTTYWWEVTDKNGTKFIYGESDQSRLKSIKNDDNKVFQWNIEKVIDANGNIIKYYYDRKNFNNGEPSTQVYLQKIAYTGTGNSDGNYSVFFNIDNGDQRRDIVINCRSGFKMETRHLLNSIDVKFKNELIRKYVFNYEEGQFYKTLLKSIEQYGESGTVKFNEHTFEYYEDVVTKDTSSFHGFTDDWEHWDNSHAIQKYAMIIPQKGISIGGNEGTRGNFSFYGGFAPFSTEKMISVGAKVGFDMGSNETFIALMDIDGDNLPDQVYKSGGNIKYRKNLGLLENGFAFTEHGSPISGLSGMGDEFSSNFTFGLQGHVTVVSGYGDLSFGSSIGKAYFNDVNGDGLIDFIKNGNVTFNKLITNSDSEFIPKFTGESVIGLDPASANINGVNSGLPAKEELVVNYHRDDPLLKWKVPYAGNIRIFGDVRLLGEPADSEEDYATEDGVKVSIYKGNNELWSATITPDNNGYITPNSPAINNLPVSAGDSIFFRVNSIDDGKYDAVEWDPEIEYIDTNTDVINENNQNMYKYKASSDFSISNQEIEWTAALGGEVQIKGKIFKERVTSDDVKVKIIKNGTDEVFSTTLAWDFTGEYDLAEEAETHLVSISATEDTPGHHDTIQCLITSDTEIDWTGIKWAPELYYLSRDDGGDVVFEIKDDEGNVVESKPLYFELPTTTRIFPVMNDTPAEPFIVPKDGEARITFKLNILETTTTDQLTGEIIGVPVNIPVGYEAEVAIAIKKRNEPFLKETGIIRHNEGGIFIDTTMQLTKDDEFFFVFASNKFNIFSYTQVDSPKIYYIADQDNDPETGKLKWENFYSANYAEYRASERNVLEYIEPFAGGFRGWHYGRWNGEKDGLNEDGTPEFDESLMKLPSAMTDVPTDTEARNEYFTDPDVQGPKDEEMKTFSQMIPNEKNLRWKGRDEDCWIGYMENDDTEEGGKIFGFSSSRVGAKYIPDPNDEMQSDTSGGSGRGVKRYTQSFQFGTGVSVVGLGVDFTTARSNTKIDYFDLNGDRFPDVVTSGGAQYTKPGGGMESGKRGISGSVRENKSINLNYGGNITSAPSLMRSVFSSDGDVKGMVSETPSPSFGVKVGQGSTITKRDYVDVNGDGLPDRISTTSSIKSVKGKIEYDGGSVKVQLNLGYGFGAAETWDSDGFRMQQTASVSVSPGLGFAVDKTSFGGGFSVSKSQSATKVSYIDINGDGLPDRVKKETDTDDSLGIIGTGKIKVNINTGNGFSDKTYTIDGADSEYPLIFDNTLVNNASVFFSIKIYIPIVGSIIINPGGGASRAIGKSEVRMQDMNGDGYVDHVYSDSNGKIKAWLNRTGKTNLLKKVSRPLGGNFEIEYQRRGNTSLMPQSKYVLSKVTINDGVEDDGGVDIYETRYEYGQGFHDRAEREFYGFNAVKEIRADGSSVTRTFNNTSYYMRGLETSNVFVDSSNKLYVSSETNFSLFPISAKVKFPQVISKVTKFYEGQINPGKITKEEYLYDSYGNVRFYKNYGDMDGSGNDETSADDVEAVINYTYNPSKYIMNNPTLITVKGNGSTYRKRQGTYDSLGNLVQLVQYAETGAQSVTNINYYSNGNIQSVIGAANVRGQRYTVSYTYDSEVQTYIEGITDSFGYTSSATYNYKYGVPITTSDINGNNIEYVYDTFGRTIEIYGPYDIGNSPTLSMAYDISSRPAMARTGNKGYWKENQTIDTITYIDGLKRVLQVKKTSEVRKTPGMTVSGKVIFDEMGRIVEQGQPIFTTSMANSFTDLSSAKNPTFFNYDVLGRKTKITYPDDTFTTMQYGFEEGKFLTAVIDQKGKIKKTHKDVRDKITRVKEYLNGSAIITNYKYNPLGEITKVIDAKGNTTNVAYDNLGRRKEIANPDSGRVTFTYDTAGNLIRKATSNLRAKGQAVHYYYNYNRLDRIDYPSMSDTTYTYGDPGAQFNRAGRIVSVNNGDMENVRFYGKLGEVVKSVKSIRSDIPAKNWRTFTTEYEFDSMGRMRSMVYPDGEELTYTYDSGGLLDGAEGLKLHKKYTYLKEIQYDEFGQRVSIDYGNGVKSEYDYDDKMRRLSHLETDQGNGNTLQNLSYTYDEVGNILQTSNEDFTTHEGKNKSVTQNYEYDDLHRLVAASGEYKVKSNKVNVYTNAFTYDTIGNILVKDQVNNVLHAESGALNAKKKTTYNLNYTYGSSKPHAVTNDGTRSYTYDLNGNMLGWTNDKNGQRRTINWDEENRMVQSHDNGNLTEYRYDDTGMRVIKRGKYGEVAYVNQNYTIRNGQVASKHVFAGNTRIATKMVFQEIKQGNGVDKDVPVGSNVPDEKFVYYYHGDHLGSSSIITDRVGKSYEHIEYFPYGETWVDEHRSENEIPYKFTSKELDPETGLYYFGARYYDTKLSRWISADDRFDNTFSMIGLDVFNYVKSNPIRYNDPTGHHAWEAQSKNASNIAQMEIKSLGKNNEKDFFIPVVNKKGKIVGEFSFTKGYSSKMDKPAKYGTEKGNKFDKEINKEDLYIMMKSGSKNGKDIYEKVKVRIDEWKKDLSKSTEGRFLDIALPNGSKKGEKYKRTYFHIKGEQVAREQVNKQSNFSYEFDKEQFLYLKKVDTHDTGGRGQSYDRHTHSSPVGQNIFEIINQK